MKRFRISYSFLLATALVLALDAQGFFLLIWSTVALHELGHLAALLLLRCPVQRVTLTLTGLRISYRPHQISYRQDVLAALAGPGANILCAVLCAIAARGFSSPQLYQFIGVSLLLADLNLLPALPLDGGRALLSLLCLRLPPDTALNVVRATGLVTGCCLFSAGVWLLIRGGNLTLLSCGVLLLYENALHRAPETV